MHTNQVILRRNFTNKVSKVQGLTVPKHVLRNIYTDLTGDATADQNKEIDERLRKAILGDDPDVVVDLRHLNKGRPGDSFKVFFDVMEKKVEEISAADERRHGVAHLSSFLSLPDLIDQVAKDCPPDTPIPSETTVLFAFAPKNAYVGTSRLYKSLFQLKFKVQSRQIRALHMDDHYCAAQFRYMREYAVKNRDVVTFVCVDDKSKIYYGEPNLAISSGVRGKKSIVPSSTVLGALDHVNSKGSLTPSVTLAVDISEELDTFYRGQVTVSLKDSVLQPSSPFRHAVEMKELLQSCANPVLMIFSDGGPDHRLTYHSVQLSLIALFFMLDVDLLIAVRTAPGHSWVNPVERLMSLLNLAYQNVAHSREYCSADVEQKLKRCNSMADIRKLSENDESVREAWPKSVQPMIDVLNDRAKRVALKGKKFDVLAPALHEDVKRC